MSIVQNILEAVGGTPMVRLQRLPQPGSAEVCVKCEFLNPGGSTKDRMALHIVRKAEERGELEAGGAIVENTSGNTGVGLAQIAAVRGYDLTVTMPDKMSQEKIDFLRSYGAKVVVTPTQVPADHPDSYYETAKRIARETPGSFYVNQYHNQDNIEAHYRSTGPEIWADTEGRIDVLVAGMGTGGTISGVGRYLKEQHPGIRIVGVDPIGSVYYDLFHTGEAGTPHVYKVEGIGEDMLCAALDLSVVDDVVQVDDRECFVTARRMAREEGLFAGGSSGGAVAVALRIAAELPEDKRVVVILPDSGNRYVSKLYNDEWMRVNGFVDDEPTASALLSAGGAELVTVEGSRPIGEVVALLRDMGISQLPMVDETRQITGMINETDLLSALVAGGRTADEPVALVARADVPVVKPGAPLAEVAEVLLERGAALVGDSPALDQVLGIVTKIDLIDHMAAKGGIHG